MSQKRSGNLGLTFSGEFLQFVPTTLVPFEPKLIDFSLMSPEQILWFNDYNKKIREIIAPHFEETGNKRAMDWIAVRTETVSPRRSKWVQMYAKEEFWA